MTHSGENGYRNVAVQPCNCTITFDVCAAGHWMAWLATKVARPWQGGGFYTPPAVKAEHLLLYVLRHSPT